MLGPLSTRLRCAGVVSAVTVGAVAVARLLTGQLTGEVDHPAGSVDAALVQVCVLALLACLTWGWAAACSVVAQAWRGAGEPLPGLPEVVRRVLLGACGVALAGALAAPAHGASEADRDGSLAGLPMPGRALGPAHPPRATKPGAETVRVRPGDSLWLITARGLPPGASASMITAGWQRLYRANRVVIGPDPGVIHPGQLLRLPSVPTR